MKHSKIVSVLLSTDQKKKNKKFVKLNLKKKIKFFCVHLLNRGSFENALLFRLYQDFISRESL